MYLKNSMESFGVYQLQAITKQPFLCIEIRCSKMHICINIMSSLRPCYLRWYNPICLSSFFFPVKYPIENDALFQLMTWSCLILRGDSKYNLTITFSTIANWYYFIPVHQCCYALYLLSKSQIIFFLLCLYCKVIYMHRPNGLRQ